MKRFPASRNPKLPFKDFNSNLRCENCKKTGHSMFACKSLNNTLCVNCGKSHLYICPLSVCKGCGGIGHSGKSCKKQGVNCLTCNKQGHSSENCLLRKAPVETELVKCVKCLRFGCCP